MVEENKEVNASDMVTKAEAAAKLLKDENDRKEQLLKREEELQAKKILGGNSSAGVAPPQPKPETNREYRLRVEKEVLSGKYDPYGVGDD